jgi:hypothetical protein
MSTINFNSDSSVAQFYDPVLSIKETPTAVVTPKDNKVSSAVRTGQKHSAMLYIATKQPS